MPVLITYHLDGATQCGPRFIHSQESSIDRFENPSTIVGFADKDVVHTFMEGVTPRVKQIFQSVMEEVVDRAVSSAIEKNFSVTDSEMKTIRAMNQDFVPDLVNKTMQKIDNWIRKDSVQEVVNVVASLPKEDMASLAEALVDVQAMKRKVSETIETVGGPVDVAVVTKG